MNREETAFYLEREEDLNFVTSRGWSDVWLASPAEALKLCYMAFSSMMEAGTGPVEFHPTAYKNERYVKLVPGKLYHERYLGVQGIGFVHHAYLKAEQQEEMLEQLKAQVAQANDLISALQARLNNTPSKALNDQVDAYLKNWNVKF
jgi:hypothetical protein